MTEMLTLCVEALPPDKVGGLNYKF
jgi:hypothetical protein